MPSGFIGNSFLVRKYVFDIGSVQVYPNYLVATFNEGVTVTMEQAYRIISISEIHFGDQEFGYISLRKNAYTIDPTMYNRLREVENLKALAIVSQKRIDMHNFKVEKMFYKKNIKFFIEFDNALTWMKKNLKQKDQKI